MKDNTQRFTGRAADYDLFRERYDAAVVLPRLREWCGLTPDWLIADVGAGTGMLSDVFLANGNRVSAVEPNAEMRSVCVEIHEGQRLLQVVDGSAEVTTLQDSSVNMVAVGRALHWFDFDRAMVEFRRIARPDGWFVSVAYGRSGDGREENVAFEQLLRKSTSWGRNSQGLLGVYDRLPEPFEATEYHHEAINGEMSLSQPELRGLALSLSQVPRVGEPGFCAFEHGLNEFFESFAVDQRIRFTTRYWINAGRF